MSAHIFRDKDVLSQIYAGNTAPLIDAATSDQAKKAGVDESYRDSFFWYVGIKCMLSHKFKARLGKLCCEEAYEIYVEDLKKTREDLEKREAGIKANLAILKGISNDVSNFLSRCQNPDNMTAAELQIIMNMRMEYKRIFDLAKLGQKDKNELITREKDIIVAMTSYKNLANYDERLHELSDKIVWLKKSMGKASTAARNSAKAIVDIDRNGASRILPEGMSANEVESYEQGLMMEDEGTKAFDLMLTQHLKPGLVKSFTFDDGESSYADSVSVTHTDRRLDERERLLNV